jgi:hypothetical protein
MKDERLKLRCALEWLHLGFKVFPIVEGQKKPVVPFIEWVDRLSERRVLKHWMRNPDDDMAIYCGESLMVLDTDGYASEVALQAIEAKHGVSAKLVIKTTKGYHHYYRLPEGVSVKPRAFSTKKFPEKIDVRSGNAYVVTAPSTGKTILRGQGLSVTTLSVATPEFIRDIHVHNGVLKAKSTDRLNQEGEGKERMDGRDMNDEDVNDEDLYGNGVNPVKRQPLSIEQLRVIYEHVTVPDDYTPWFQLIAALSHETSGSHEGEQLAMEWSRLGRTYKNDREIQSMWKSLGKGRCTRPITLAHTIRVLANDGYDWRELCASLEPEFEVVPMGVNAQGLSGKGVNP